MYEGFSNVYDHVMNHIPYEDWFEKLHVYLKWKGIETGTLCELGCGTGTMTEKFAAAGYQVIGVDQSPEMLALAKAKETENVQYIEQRMEALELAEPVDAVYSVCDSINYLMQESALLNTFTRVKEYLKPGGYFIFDMKTIYCYRNIIGNQTWVEQDEEVSYIWENYFYEDEDVNEYMLTIFRKQPDSELYERIEEAHYQKAYRMEILQKLLEESGLEFVESFDESLQAAPGDTSERIYVVARNADE